MKISMSGVFAALITPIDDLGRPDLAAFDRLIDFAIDCGVDGVVIGGATAEYPHFDIGVRASLARQAVKRIAGRGRVITCVGTSSIYSTLSLAKSAADAGSDALLLPMPYFFRYNQDDLIAYTKTVCASVPTPFLLYNLPFCTSEIRASTAVRLLKTIPNLIGIKDSSGKRSNLERLGRWCKEYGYETFVGDDSLLLDALRSDWDGVVSGIACFVPELIIAEYRNYRAGNTAQATSYQAMLDTLIQEVIRLPIPWGVRVGIGERGITSGPMHLPLSKARQRQVEHLRAWLQDWAAARDLRLDQVWKSIPLDQVS